MTTHELKTWTGPFEAVVEGRKRFEYRKNDRDFKVDDTLVLREWNNTKEEYTGRSVEVRCLYILSGMFGVPDDHCIISISDPRPVQGQRDHDSPYYKSHGDDVMIEEENVEKERLITPADRALIKYLEERYDVDVWTSNQGGDVYIEGFAIIIRPKTTPTADRTTAGVEKELLNELKDIAHNDEILYTCFQLQKREKLSDYETVLRALKVQTTTKITISNQLNKYVMNFGPQTLTDTPSAPVADEADIFEEFSTVEECFDTNWCCDACPDCKHYQKDCPPKSKSVADEAPVEKERNHGCYFCDADCGCGSVAGARCAGWSHCEICGVRVCWTHRFHQHIDCPFSPECHIPCKECEHLERCKTDGIERVFVSDGKLKSKPATTTIKTRQSEEWDDVLDDLGKDDNTLLQILWEQGATVTPETFKKMQCVDHGMTLDGMPGVREKAKKLKERQTSEKNIEQYRKGMRRKGE